MQNYLHKFHIPVMGTGHSIDTPIRVAPFGISSVISIVDDILIDKVRHYYSEKFKLPKPDISRKDVYGRSKRITEYLNVVGKIVHIKMDEIKRLPFFENNDKSKYFRMLPENSFLKNLYEKLLQSSDESEKAFLSGKLTDLMEPGSIDVNIMAKVDNNNYAKNGAILSAEFSDAKAALRGYAESDLNSSIIFSAGFNRGLFNFLTGFKDFYRNEKGELKKKIIIKVSDFRSALIQGKFLAMKGLEVSEYRIESGLNCGGHAFPSQGQLLPLILDEFKKKKEQLTEQITPLLKNFYEKMKWDFTEDILNEEPSITVQGGIGTSGEASRFLNDFNCSSTGWGSPFLLVPQATCVDDETLELLINAKKEDLYLSNASPLGVPFNNLRMTGSEKWTKERTKNGRPGSPCPKGFLVSNNEYSEKPICTASRQYQKKKLIEIALSDVSPEEKDNLEESTLEKVCLCEHLGNGALIKLGIQKNGSAPQAICPGPNIVWFKKKYSLVEMVDHIYGRNKSLVSEDRPHMFCQEVELYINYLEKISETIEMNSSGIKYLETFVEKLNAGMDFILNIAREKSYPNENLESIPSFITLQRERLKLLVLNKLENITV